MTNYLYVCSLEYKFQNSENLYKNHSVKFAYKISVLPKKVFKLEATYFIKILERKTFKKINKIAFESKLYAFLETG